MTADAKNGMVVRHELDPVLTPRVAGEVIGLEGEEWDQRLGAGFRVEGLSFLSLFGVCRRVGVAVAVGYFAHGGLVDGEAFLGGGGVAVCGCSVEGAVAFCLLCGGCFGESQVLAGRWSRGTELVLTVRRLTW